jgi:hypothetical protein
MMKTLELKGIGKNIKHKFILQRTTLSEETSSRIGLLRKAK